MKMQETVLFKGNPVTLCGPRLAVGDQAPNAVAVDNALGVVTINGSYPGRIRIISTVPSLDTPICDAETRRFNQEVAALPEQVVLLTVSMDLPFAQKRWCAAAGIDRVITLSDYRERAVGMEYGVMIEKLMLLSRAVFVVDANNVIRYIQQVPEVTTEPDYAAVMDAVTALL